MLFSNTCIIPWVHLHTHGNVKACCNANITFGNVNTQSLVEIWNGAKANKFRERTLNNERDNRCGSCWKREDAVKTSTLTETLIKFKVIKIDQEVNTEIKIKKYPRRKILLKRIGAVGLFVGGIWLV
jgi:hypothetical protein